MWTAVFKIISIAAVRMTVMVMIMRLRVMLITLCLLWENNYKKQNGENSYFGSQFLRSMDEWFYAFRSVAKESSCWNSRKGASGKTWGRKQCDPFHGLLTVSSLLNFNSNWVKTELMMPPISKVGLPDIISHL